MKLKASETAFTKFGVVEENVLFFVTQIAISTFFVSPLSLVVS
jgi:hypothetical protein